MSKELRGQLAGQAGANVPTIHARCSYLPKALPATSNSHFTLDAAGKIFAGTVVYPALMPRGRETQRVFLIRSHLKRGPPSLRA
jgi:hypothetical protein